MTPTEYALKAEFARIEGNEEKAREYERKRDQAILLEKYEHEKMFKSVYGGLF